MIQGTIIALLKANAAIAEKLGTRIYLVSVPQEQRSYPVAIVRRISAVRDLHHAGSTGVVESRIQIDVIGKTMSAALDAAKTISDFFHGYRGIGAGNEIFYSTLENELEFADEDIGFQVALDFLVTHTE